MLDARTLSITITAPGKAFGINEMIRNSLIALIAERDQFNTFYIRLTSMFPQSAPFY